MDFNSAPNAKFPPCVPFKEKWKLLKDDLERLYLEKKLTLPEIVKLMKEMYGFDANIPQYKYQFKSWGWGKNIPSATKAKMFDVSQTRAAEGKSTVIKYKHHEIDPNKLRRHAKTVARNVVAMRASAEAERFPDGGLFNPSVPLGDTTFLRWHLPYKALRQSNKSRAAEYHYSPTMLASTPNSDISVTTPPTNLSPSQVGISPLSRALNVKRSTERAQLFIHGRVDELLKSMDIEEREMTTTWLNQFWTFAFRTAKHWGRGPRDWTAGSLGFTSNRDPSAISLRNTPNYGLESPKSTTGHQVHALSVPQPSPLCRWSIHVREEEDYEPIPSPSPDSDHGYADPENQETWKEWPQSWRTPPFEEKIVAGLQSNLFSSISEGELPLSISQIARTISKSPNMLLVESLGFAIMGQNIELVESLTKSAKERSVDLSGLYPLHLAAAYLDGSKSCCNVLDCLNMWLPQEFRLSKNPRNALGYTVFDSLMITIIKGHSTTMPALVDVALSQEVHFTGDEHDICGRWDADSDCYRALSASGSGSVPQNWKHKLCHTATQTICHCIQLIGRYSGFLTTPSGLFLRYCSHCGEKLQLFPLHTLVVTTFQLAQAGFRGEDLFGMLSILLCMLCHGADLSLQSHISVAALLGEDDSNCCNHELLRPGELAERVPVALIKQWSSEAQTGWQLFCYVLIQAQQEQIQHEKIIDDDHDDPLRYQSQILNGVRFRNDCNEHTREGIDKVFANCEELGHLWAACQTELLSYRRLTEKDTWTSEYFDMKKLLKSLNAGKGVNVEYVKNGMMKPYCGCGLFGWDISLREDTAEYYFSNLDDYSRLSLISLPSRLSQYFLAEKPNTEADLS